MRGVLVRRERAQGATHVLASLEARIVVAQALRQPYMAQDLHRRPRKRLWTMEELEDKGSVEAA